MWYCRPKLNSSATKKFPIRETSTLLNLNMSSLVAPKQPLSISFIFFILLLLLSVRSTIARRRHVINFRSPNLYPKGLTWDPIDQHFIVSSLHQRSIHSISDAGVVQTLISDSTLPPNVTILGLTIDSVNRHLLAVINAMEPLPAYNALAAYDLRTRKRVFLSVLNNENGNVRHIANGNDVTADFKGNAYVTNSAGNFIWKINDKGESSTFSRSPAFTSKPVDADKPYSFCSLNGVAYISKGYLLVVQTNTGKLYKVDSVDGKAKVVLLSENLTAADGIAVRGDGIVVIVSQFKAWLLKSEDSWGEAVVYDTIALDTSRFPTSVTVREDKRAYVIYGHVDEGILGKVERESFAIEVLESEKDDEDEKVWIFVLIGLGLAYFMYWRFQMGQLVKNMNKKTA